MLWRWVRVRERDEVASAELEWLERIGYGIPRVLFVMG